MPLSDYRHIPTVLHYALALQPQSVLDVGVGTGTYGFLLREFLELDGACDSWADRCVRIEGIESFESYRSPVWEVAYDRVYLGDARTLLPTLGSYDLVLMNDVLEHFDRSEARGLVRQALKHGRAVIATTPNRWMPQGPFGGNEAETHRSLLTGDDFPSVIVAVPVAVTTCFVCSTDSDVIARVRAVTPSCPVARVRSRERLKSQVIRVAAAAPRALRAWRKVLARMRHQSAPAG